MIKKPRLTLSALALMIGLLPVSSSLAEQMDETARQVAHLQSEWARVKYQIPGKEAQLDAIHELETYAAQVSAAHPDRAEPKVWEGIILSTDAGIDGGLSALGKVKQARNLFEQSLAIDPNALQGSAHTSLGALYYQVPGWPIAFGDDDEAEKHLKQALAINPTGIDPNFFYADFLMQDGRKEEAMDYFKRALNAPNRPDRLLADAARRQEAKAKLAELAQKEVTYSQKSRND